MQERLVGRLGGTGPRGPWALRWRCWRTASTMQISWPAQRLVLLFHRPGLLSQAAHAFLAIAPAIIFYAQLYPVSFHQSSCRDCCLHCLTPRPLPSLCPPASCIHVHAPQRAWPVAPRSLFPAIRRSTYDDTTTLIHKHTPYRTFSQQHLTTTTTAWLAP